MITPFEFQKYILNIWKIQFELMNARNNKNCISLYERTPEDSVLCFSYLDKINSCLSNQEYQILINKCNQLFQSHPFPQVSNTNTCISVIYNISNTSINYLLNKIIFIISRDLEIGIQNRIIYIRTDVATALNRINTRNRNGEDLYSYSQLTQIQERYDNLYLYQI